MRWITRLLVFLLSITAGASALYILAQNRSAPVETEEKAAESPPVQTDVPETPWAEQSEVSQSVKFGPVEPVAGYVNKETITLRESPDKMSPIIAKLKMGEYYQAEILGATRDFLHVRFAANDGSSHGAAAREKDYEGWTNWGSVMPNMSALVLDAETGAVISRIPLNSDLTSIAYSPGGSRAIFFGGEGGITQTAYEIRTSDYTLTRSLTSTGKDYFGTLFYGIASGALYATVYPVETTRGERGSKIGLARIGDEGAAAEPAQIGFTEEDNFIVSPDGSTGFILRKKADGVNDMTVDVLDLTTRSVRNTFTLSGLYLHPGSGDFAMSRDGSEFYVKLSETADTISVLDTRTGQRVRELPFILPANGSYFSQGDLVGDSVLVSVWENGEDEMHAHRRSFWVGSGGSVAADRGIAFAAEADGKRFAVNAEGTRLFKLDNNNHIQERLVIERPDLTKGADEVNGLTVFGLKVSPDGKRLIIFLGIEDGC